MVEVDLHRVPGRGVEAAGVAAVVGEGLGAHLLVRRARKAPRPRQWKPWGGVLAMPERRLDGLADQPGTGTPANGTGGGQRLMTTTEAMPTMKKNAASASRHRDGMARRN